MEKATISMGEDAMNQNVIGVEKGTIGVGGDIEKGMRYDQELFEFVEKTKKRKIAFGEFGMLHRLNLVDILNDIANCRAAIWKDKSASETERKKLRVTLREYTQAIRDYDYMKRMAPCEYHDTIDWTDDLNNTFKEIARKPYYPYSAKYRVLEEIKQPGEDTLRIILTNILRSRAYRTKEGWERAKAKRTGDVNQVGIFSLTQPQEPSRILDDLAFFLPRFAITFFCGSSLIAPMVIMTLHKSQTKSLITTSIAVVLVAGLLAYMKAKNSDIIAGTATYAAVLVVFVGLSS